MIDIKLDKSLKDYRVSTDAYNYTLSKVSRDKEGNITKDKTGTIVYRNIAYLHSFKDAIIFAKRYELEANPDFVVTSVDDLIDKINSINDDFSLRNWKDNR